MAGFAYVYNGSTHKLTSTNMLNPTLGTARVCVRTGAGANDILKYGLTTDVTATQYANLAFRVSGSNCYLGRSSTWNTSSTNTYTYTQSVSNQYEDYSVITSYYSTDDNYNWNSAMSILEQSSTTLSTLMTQIYSLQSTSTIQYTKSATAGSRSIRGNSQTGVSSSLYAGQVSTSIPSPGYQWSVVSKYNDIEGLSQSWKRTNSKSTTILIGGLNERGFATSAFASGYSFKGYYVNSLTTKTYKYKLFTRNSVNRTSSTTYEHGTSYIIGLVSGVGIMTSLQTDSSTSRSTRRVYDMKYHSSVATNVSLTTQSQSASYYGTAMRSSMLTSYYGTHVTYSYITTQIKTTDYYKTYSYTGYWLSNQSGVSRSIANQTNPGLTSEVFVQNNISQGVNITSYILSLYHVAPYYNDYFSSYYTFQTTDSIVSSSWSEYIDPTLSYYCSHYSSSTWSIDQSYGVESVMKLQLMYFYKSYYTSTSSSEQTLTSTSTNNYVTSSHNYNI